MDDRAVQRAVEALTDDYARQSGRLRVVEVERTIDRRKLGPEEALEVWRQLQSIGIVPEAEGERGWTPTRKPSGYSAWGSDPDLIRQYLAEIGRIRLLTAQDELELGRRIALGRQAEQRRDEEEAELGTHCRDYDETIARGRAAWATLVVSNLRLVVSIAKKSAARTKRLDLLDLIQEGNLGLFKAADKFDYTMEFKFSTYATWWIRQRIDRALANTGRLIRIPVHASETLARINRARTHLIEALGREPSVREIAERLDLQPEQVRFLLDASQEPVSLNAPIVTEDDDGNELVDFLDVGDPFFNDPAEIVERVSRRDDVLAALLVLNDREKDIIEQRYGLVDGIPRTLDEVGRAYGLTRERIRQIQQKAEKKLRAPLLEHFEELADTRPASSTNGTADEDAADETPVAGDTLELVDV